MRICRLCSKEFEEQTLGNWYCCEECRTKARKRSKEESRRRRTAGGNYNAVLERDGNKCRRCGTTEKLQVHHIDKSGKSDNPNNDLSNLITLCKSCHARLHGIDKDSGAKRNTNVVCPICSKHFYAAPYRLLRTRVPCCSKKCLAQYKALPEDELKRRQKEQDWKRNKDPKRQEYKRLQIAKRRQAERIDSGQQKNPVGFRICPICNQEFHVQQYRLVKDKIFYCSPKCWGISKTLSPEERLIREKEWQKKRNQKPERKEYMKEYRATHPRNRERENELAREKRRKIKEDGLGE